ncbi:hypothetical protein F503_08360 [Ophiostoma piceae UAMH 11346]|uniref:Uncharacterized protein n=1 Tax=Ophiostoma piceae (strain UAMH 11346) TaxID=1262450 RepID=S3BX54_OPHP1|nr:hypothetical protein F503_08360 [Ophiostoma piceae UAMH 11346]
MSEHKVAGQVWRPSVTAHVPWLSLTFMAGFVGCCVGLGVVLANSDNKVVDTWPSKDYPIAVSVILSLLVSIANVCLAGALSKGYEIAWWLEAIKGAELQSLQFDLSVQTSLGAMLSSGIAFNQFSLAAVIALIVTIIDGPIIQKASNVVVKTRDPTLGLVAATVLDGYLPANFSAYGTSATPDLLTPMFSNVSLAYQNRDPIRMPISACSGGNTTCSLSFPGLGFDVYCNESTKAYDFAELGSATRNNNVTTFSVATEYGASESTEDFLSIRLTSSYKPDGACAGNLVKRSCSLRLSTVNYPMSVTNGTAVIEPWDVNRNDTIAWSDISEDDARDTLFTGTFGAGGLWTMLGGIYGVLNNVYSASTVLVLKTMTAVPFIVEGTGASASNYITSDASTYGNCTMTWSDPTADYINTARELMLRSVLVYANAAPDNTSTQALSARLTTIATSYQSDYKYLYATMGSMAVLMLMILFMLSGWHRLGRVVSLDAFEIARALGAPLLQSGSTNSDITTSLRPIRYLKLRYGEVHRADPKAYVAQAGMGVASAQQDTEYYGNNDSNGDSTYALVASGEDQRMSRLGLIEAHRAADIRRGVLY